MENCGWEWRAEVFGRLCFLIGAQRREQLLNTGRGKEETGLMEAMFSVVGESDLDWGSLDC